MKKVALVHFAYPPNFGGVEMVISQQARVLSDLGFSVTLLVGSGEEHDPRITLFAIPELQSLIQFAPSLQEKIMAGTFDEAYDTLVEKIASVLEVYGKDQDVLIVHNIMTLYRNIAFVEAFTAYAKKHPEKKCIIWVHDHIFLVDGEKLDKKQDNARLVALLTTPIPGATYVVISHTFAKRLEKVLPIPAENVHVISDGVSIKDFLEIDNVLWTSLQAHHIMDAFPLILAPVNILPRKNLEYTVAVFAALQKTYPKAKMLISGALSVHRNTTEYLSHIENRIASLSLQDDVIFLKDIIKNDGSDTIIHDLYAVSDVVFYFSKSENFGLPLLETSLFKTPIFISDLPVFHEIGGELLSYIHTENTLPQDAAESVVKRLGENDMVFREKVKKQYLLETILKEKLLPLL